MAERIAVITLRLTEAERERLQQAADAEGLTTSQAVRRAIKAWLEGLK